LKQEETAIPHLAGVRMGWKAKFENYLTLRVPWEAGGWTARMKALVRSHIGMKRTRLHTCDLSKAFSRCRARSIRD
jgi:hypothetical protein